MKKSALFGIIVVCLAALVYLSLAAPDVETPPPLPTAVEAASGHPSSPGENSVPPDFTLKSIDGASFSLSALKGKVVMLNFWSANCGPCLMEMPAMEKLYQAMKGKPFEILAITSDPPELAEAASRKLAVSFPIVIDPDSSTAFAYQVYGTPTTYIIAPDGSVAFGGPGAYNWGHPTVIDFIGSLLAQANPAPGANP